MSRFLGIIRPMGSEVSVIIPVYNKASSIAQTICSLRQNSILPDKIIVIDDCSSDGSAELLHTFMEQGWITVLRTSRRTGAAKARNIAAQTATTEYLFFLDADCVASTNWIEAGLASLRQPGTVAVEGAIRYENSLPTFSNKVPVNPFYSQPVPGVTSNAQRDFPSGNFAVRTAAFRRLGGFDSARFTTGREDTDLGFRLLTLGQVAYNGAMTITHGEEFWTLRNLIESSYRYAGDVVFFKKHRFFRFAMGPVLHPRLLLFTVFPLGALFLFRFRKLRDFLLLPKFWLYLCHLRITIWKTAYKEQVFVL